MNIRDLPSPELLRKLLRYEPETGLLFWRERHIEFFKDVRGRNSWNTRYAGKQAFTATNSNGYKCGGIFDKMYKAHRVIWAMETGAWPVEELDHENHKKSDNRFDNLSEATHHENMKNLSLRHDNASGICGVSWNKHANKWVAYINRGGKRLQLGYFNEKSKAIAARKTAEVKYQFHSNHGK